MEGTLTIFPNNKEDANLYKQLAKRLNNKVIVTKGQKLKSKEQFLDDLSESIREVKLHMEGKLHLQTAEELLYEL